MRWKGYPDSDNQWLDKDDIFAEDAIRKFKRCHPTKERHIKTLRGRAKSPAPFLLPMNTSPDNYDDSHVDVRVLVAPYHPDLQALDAVEVLNKELAEARANFPTPPPGRLSPDSYDLGELDLAPSTTIQAMEGSSKGVEEGTAVKIPSMVGPTWCWVVLIGY